MSQQINLYNPRLERQKNYLSTRLLVAVLGVVVVGLAGAAVVARSQLATVEREAEALKREVAEHEARRVSVTAAFVPRRRSATLQQEVDAAAIEYRNLKQVAALLDQDQGRGANARGYSAYFRALARKRVDGLWLTGVTIDQGGEAIGLQGRTLKPSLLPGYLDGLAGEPVLRGKSFGQLEMREPKPAASAPDAPAPRYVEFSLQSLGPGEHGEARRP